MNIILRSPDPKIHTSSLGKCVFMWGSLSLRLIGFRELVQCSCNFHFILKWESQFNSSSSSSSSSYICFPALHGMRKFPDQESNPRPPAVEVWNLNHWTTREVPVTFKWTLCSTSSLLDVSPFTSWLDKHYIFSCSLIRVHWLNSL